MKLVKRHLDDRRQLCLLCMINGQRIPQIVRQVNNIYCVGEYNVFETTLLT